MVNPQVELNPVLTLAKMIPPETGTGVLLLVVEPFPRRPLPLFPQQYAAPPIATPHVCQFCPALSDAKGTPPTTATGTELFWLLPLVPFPNSPYSFNPQHQAEPLVVRPHAKRSRLPPRIA